MTDTLAYVLRKFDIALNGQKSPIVVPNFGRSELAAMFAELGFTKGVEVGVNRGEYSEVLLKANPNLHLYGVDHYLAYSAYRELSQERQDECRAEAHKRLASYESEGRYQFIEKPSVEAAREFPDGALDYCYIDASHKLQDVVNDICEWSRVVRPGGICAGHDFVRRTRNRDGSPNTSLHVVQAVTAYTQAYSIHPYFILGRRSAREGEVRDKARSWCWIKS